MILRFFMNSIRSTIQTNNATGYLFDLTTNSVKLLLPKTTKVVRAAKAMEIQNLCSMTVICMTEHLIQIVTAHSWTDSRLRTSLLLSRLYVGRFPGCLIESHIIVRAAARSTTGMIIDA